MSQIIDNSKVSDHHAIIPTMTVKGIDLSSLVPKSKVKLGAIHAQEDKYL